MTTSAVPESAAPVRWADLAGRRHGDPDAPEPAFVLLHGLTFDRRMWYPLLEVLPEGRQAIAFDLPGHGGSPALGRRGLEAVAEAVHAAVAAAGLDAPIVVGHSIGGPIASIYAAVYPTSGVVTVDTPIRFEPFAEQLRMLRPQLEGEGFGQAWERFRESMRFDLLTDAQRAYVPDHPSREVFLSYQADLLERPLDELIHWRDEALSRVRSSGIPYVALRANPVDPEERAFLAERLPQAEVLVWPVGHHFPHVAEPKRFGRLLTAVAQPSRPASAATRP
jgi:pimeloyl-ACP methyl ester carboxylesterase